MEESRNNQQSASEEFILPHQQFDIVAKDPFYVFPEDMLRFLMDRLDFEFIDGQSILEAEQPGLMPFTPLMRPPADMTAVEWTTHCAEVMQALPIDTATRNNLMVELWVMSGLAHERQDLLTLIPEDIVKESSVYQMIIERGIERGVERGIQEGKQLGAKEFAIERILNLLNRRFNVSIAPALTPSLEAIDNLQHLSQLMDEATEAEHLENFIQTLQTFHNGT